MSRIGAADLQFLADHGFVIVEKFLPRSISKELIQDVLSLRGQNEDNKINAKNYFSIAKIGHDGMIQDETTPYRDIRFSETCALTRCSEKDKEEKSNILPPSEAREELYEIIDHLRSDLQLPLLSFGRYTKDVPVLDNELEEIMYAYYPKGGYYRRHRDAEKDSISNWRKYSFLLYLNPNWEPSHGGQLRLHRDSGGDSLPPGELPNFLDVEPKMGTLVLFRSDCVPHEVLDTQHERMVIVGWFLSKTETNRTSTEITLQKNTNNEDDKDIIPPTTLSALRSLRGACSRLKYKLEPTINQTQRNQHQQSGLLGDDFLFPTETSKPLSPSPSLPVTSYDDTDPSYWKPIATLSVEGHVNTLSLNGQRLREVVHLDFFKVLVQHVVTLDLGNTDLSCAQLVALLQKLSKKLQHLYLAGFGVGNDLDGFQEVVNQLPIQMHLLDLRYNDLDSKGASILRNYLAKSNCLCRVLHLEGNMLQDEGTKQLLSSITKSHLQELYLGQNRMGPIGAQFIASNLSHFPQLKKLYLEGNQIGAFGARAFRISLESMKKTEKVLEKLYVDNNGIGKDEALKLGAALNSATMIGTSAFFEEEEKARI